jgi:penicillin-binding protein 1A
VTDSPPPASPGDAAAAPAALPPRRKRRIFTSIFRIAFFGAAAFVTITTAAAVGLFMGYVRTLPPIEQLEDYSPPEVTLVTDRTGGLTIGELKDENRYVTPIDQIPLRLQQAFLAIEDARFYQHFGIDPIGVLRAIYVNLTSQSRLQGASTITQQLTRNVLQEEVGFARRLERKIKEAILALQIERRYSKAQILEFYLNHIPFNYNAFGVRAAASTYFSKELDELTLSECATLAAMPKSASMYNPILHPDRARTRRNLVLGRMLDVGYVTREEYDAATSEPLATRRGYGMPSLYPYFLDAFGKNLVAEYGLSFDYLKKGGLRLTATVDPRIQDACIAALRNGLVQVEREWQATKLARHYEDAKEWDGVVRAGQSYLMRIESVGQGTVEVRLNDYRGSVTLPDDLPYYEPANVIDKGKWIDVTVKEVSRGVIAGELTDTRPVQGAIVVLDVHTGEVLGLVGGSNYYASVGGSWNLATMGGRQPGSALKPLFYAAAMERGIEPNTIIVDEPIQYGADYRPINYEKVFFGPNTLIEALEHSRNVTTLRLFEGLGVKRTLDFVRQFDFSRSQSRWSLPQEISTCLGTIDATPLEIASAYQAIANLGLAIRPQYLRSALGRDGEVAFPPLQVEQPIMDPVAAYQTQYMLRQVVLQGTGYTPIGSKFKSPPYPPICGKTGTTSDNYDGWFAGFTPDLAIVVQVGFEPRRPMGPKMTGGRLAGPIWAAVFEEIHKTRTNWQMEYDIPPGLEFVDTCAVTGKRVSDICGNYGHKIYRAVPYRIGDAPARECNDVPLTPWIAPIGPAYSEWAGESPVFGYARRPDPNLMPGVDFGDSDEGDYFSAPGTTFGGGAMDDSAGGADVAVPALPGVRLN